MAAPASTSSQELDLNDATYFPSFHDLPYENDVNFQFHSINPNGVLSPSHHWVFLAEIVEDQTVRFLTSANHIVMSGGLGFTRPRYLVRDQQGTGAQIAFHTTPEDMNTYGFNEKKYGIGNTIAVFYANSHRFMDGSVGLRIEELMTVKVIPCPLQTLLSADPSIVVVAKSCKHCANESGELLACARCKTKYCSQKCQRADWTKHKADCLAIQQVTEWRKRDWRRFDGSWDTAET